MPLTRNIISTPRIAAFCMTLAFAFSLLSSDVQAEKRFVKTNGPTAHGSAASAKSWATACNDLQAVINASAAGDTIFVAAGEYRPNRKANATATITAGDRQNAFVLKAGVRLFGSFPSNATDAQHKWLASRPQLYPDNLPTTTLSGDIDGITDTGDAMTGFNGIAGNVHHVVIAAAIDAASNTVMDGFRITGGYSDSNLSITVNGETLQGNQGSGLYLSNSFITLNNLYVTANSTIAYGAGMHSYKSDYLLSNSILSNNRSSGANGGAISNDGNKNLGTHIFNVQIRKNYASSNGGGIFNRRSKNLKLTNVLVADNATNGNGNGGICNTDSENLIFTNITVVNNGGNQYTAGGIQNNYAAGVFEINNSILWGHTGIGDIANSTGSSYTKATISNSLVWSIATSAWSQLGIDHGNNFSANPLFIDAANGNYNIPCSSPAANAGDTARYKSCLGVTGNLAAHPDAIDLNHLPRYVGASIDVGACESQSLYCVKADQAGIVYVKERGAGLMDGSSWENAHPNLADPLLVAGRQRSGLEGALSSTDTIRQIWVARGTYYPMHGFGGSTDPRDRTFTLVPGVKLYGGFPDNANSTLHNTIASRGALYPINEALLATLSGNIDGVQDTGNAMTGFGGMDGNVYRVMMGGSIDHASNTVVDGFKITGGNGTQNAMIVFGGERLPSDGGSALFLVNSFITLNHLYITANSTGGGGALRAYKADYLLSNSLLKNNRTGNGNAGALYNYMNSSLPGTHIFNVQIRENYASSNGGGVYCLYSKNLKLTNVLVADNKAAGGGSGGISISYTENLVFTNITVVNNGGNQYSAGGLYNYRPAGALEINNSIFWGHTGRGDIFNNPTSGNTMPTFSNCIIGDLATKPWSELGTNNGNNRSDDPMFANAANRNYRPHCNSPAVNAGDTAAYKAARGITGNLSTHPDAIDLDKLPRYFGANIDMGAYETRKLYCVNADSAGIVYVKDGGDGLKDGSSWENAYPNLADPLLVAGRQRSGLESILSSADSIHQIWVARGTYYPMHGLGGSTDPRSNTFALVPGVKIYGGFPRYANSTVHNNIKSRGDLYPIVDSLLTTLSGDIDGTADAGDAMNGFSGMQGNAYHVVVGLNLNMADSATVDGFKITGGNGKGGSTVTVDNRQLDQRTGAGIHLNNAGAVLTNLLITGNQARGAGGGLYAEASPYLFSNSIVSNNCSETYEGGGIYNTANSVDRKRIFGVEITANRAYTTGGGMQNSSTNRLTMANVLLADNVADNGGGMYNSAVVDARMTSLTVTRNTATGSGAGGIYSTGLSEDFDIFNSIVWGNTGGTYADTRTVNYSGLADPYWSKSIIGGLAANGWSEIGFNGLSNFDVDPEFEDAANRNYRLLPSSPAVDAGDTTLYKAAAGMTSNLLGNRAAVDLDKLPRYVGADLDMGAYEMRGIYVIKAGQGGTVYVQEGGRGRQTGSSWEDAYPNIADPLRLADLQRQPQNTQQFQSDTVRRIWAGVGTYYPIYRVDTTGTARDRSFTLVKGVKLYGGFPANASSAVHNSIDSRGLLYPLADSTLSTLSGDIDRTPDAGDAMSGFGGMDGNVYHVVAGSGIGKADSVVVDGFRITGGNSNSAGTFILNGNPLTHRYGGGIYLIEAAPILAHLLIEGNRAEEDGGGVYALSSPYRLSNSAVINNRADADAGGGMYNAEVPVSGMSFFNVEIRANRASSTGGGMHNSRIDSASFVNMLVADNFAGSGGGIFNEMSGPTVFSNLTLTRNSCGAGSCGGMSNYAISDEVYINNSIIWGNSGGTTRNIFNSPGYLGDIPTFRNSIIGDVSTRGWQYVGVDSGANIDLDPQFIDTARGNYGLYYRSKAVNAGDTALYKSAMGITSNLDSHPDAIDLNRQPRLVGAGMDMGAYEAQQPYLIYPNASGTVYVKVQGRGVKDGSTWENAYPNLADPLRAAALQRQGLYGRLDPGDTIRQIWVARGTYYPLHCYDTITSPRGRTFFLTPRVKIYGGFPDYASTAIHNNIESRGALYPIVDSLLTTLSGDVDGVPDAGDAMTGFSGMDGNVHHVVAATKISLADSVVVDGFRITGGNANGAGAYEADSLNVLRSRGGGLFLNVAGVTLNNLHVTGNFAADAGGGLYAHTPDYSLSNSTFSNNLCTPGLGGAITNERASRGILRIFNVDLRSNRAAMYGGGMVNSNIHGAEMANVLVRGNVADNGAGVTNGGASATKQSNFTIAGNISTGGNTGGLLNVMLFPGVEIGNFISWGNVGGRNKDIFLQNTPAQNFPIITSSLLGGSSTQLWDSIGVDNDANIDVDPLFVDAAAGNYRLRCNSPAANVGDTSMYKYVLGITANIADSPYAVDLDNSVRLFGAGIDMGAYELQQTSCLKADLAGIVYVKENGAGLMDGSSWENAYPNLGDPLHEAARQRQGQAGTLAPADTIRQIWIARGTYYPMHCADTSSNPRDRSFTLVPGVKLYGGFPRYANSTVHNTVESRGDLYPIVDSLLTTLSGDIDGTADTGDAMSGFGGMDGNVLHVVVASGLGIDDSVALDGFAITGGNANGADYAVVNNSNIYRNRGGGLFCIHSDLILNNLLITGNRASDDGGGLYSNTSDYSLSNSVVSNNLAEINSGGGINNERRRIAGMSIFNVQLIANRAGQLGGGMCNVNTTGLRMANVLATANVADCGGGIYSNALNSSMLSNLTVTGNISTSGCCGGMLTGVQTGGVYVSNSIFWGNTGGSFPDAQFIRSNAYTPTVYTNCIIQNLSALPWDSIGVNNGANIELNPQFVDAAAGNCRLRCGSPAVNAGDTAMYKSACGITANLADSPYAVDLDALPRLFGASIDMGAYELQQASCLKADLAGIVYVKENGAGLMDGSSWENAYPNLGDPLHEAARQRQGQAGTLAPADTIRQIWIARGTYYPMHCADTSSNPRNRSFTLVPGVKLYGGFPRYANSTQHNTVESRGDLYPIVDSLLTVLSGDIDGVQDTGDAMNGFGGMDGNVRHVVVAAGVDTIDNVTLDGFKITGGNANNSTGVQVNGESLTGTVGGGVYLVNSFVTLNNLHITANSSNVYGAGLTSYQSDYLLSNSILSNNRNSNGSGGAITNTSDKNHGTHIFNVQISGNYAEESGGAMFNNSSKDLKLTNVLIADNKANSVGVGGIFNESVYGSVFTNITVVRNSSPSSYAGGIYNARTGSVFEINNSIIWGNTGAGDMISDPPAGFVLPTINNCIIGDIATASWSDIGINNGGNLSSDPLFLDTANRNYRLHCASPAVNAGDTALYKAARGIVANLSTHPDAVDLDYLPRYYGTGIDMGAYESRQRYCVNADSAGIVYVKETGAGLMDGSSWENAYPNLGDPLHVAGLQRKALAGTLSPADTIRQIWIARGTYYPMHCADTSSNPRDRSFTLVPGVKLYGGFPRYANSTVHNTIESRGDLYPIVDSLLTTLSGDIDGVQDTGDAINGFVGMDGNVHHVVVVAGAVIADSTTVDGFAITGGNANGADYAGVNNSNIYRNRGGGLFCVNSDLILNNLLITGNSANVDGGGLYSSSSDYSLSNAVVSNNLAEIYNGGGICNDMRRIAGISIFNVQLIANRAVSCGGGILNGSASNLRMANVLATANMAEQGAGIYNGSLNSSSFSNLTVTGNISTAGRCGGMLTGVQTGGVYVSNSIFWGNTGGSFPDAQLIPSHARTQTVYTNCIIQNLSALPWDSIGVDNVANIELNPQFVDAAAGNYRLHCSSPAVNAGDTAMYKSAWGITANLSDSPYAVDLDRLPRLYGASIDMGAYELNRAYCINPDLRGIVYVKEQGTGSQDGSSWENAYPNLADPLLYAGLQRQDRAGTLAPSDTIRQIWVARGTYYPLHRAATQIVGGGATSDKDLAFVLVPGVKLYGGFPANASSTLHNTIDSRDSLNLIKFIPLAVLSGDIDGDSDGGSFTTGFTGRSGNVHHVLIASNIQASDSVVIDGFELRGGNATGSHSIHVRGYDIPASVGGGLCSYGSNFLLRNLRLRDNAALEYGGGIYTDASALGIENAAATYNRAETGGHGGGMAFFGSDNSVNKSSLQANFAQESGAGMYIEGGAPVLSNTLITDNFADRGAALTTAAAANIVMVNLTIANNTANNAGSAAGICIEGTSSLELFNSIVWNNKSRGAVSNFKIDQGCRLHYDYNDVNGLGSFTNGSIADMGNNIDKDPEFVRAAMTSQVAGDPLLYLDYRLRCNSPAINIGDNTVYEQTLSRTLNAAETDLADSARLYGTAIDLGAYENLDSICIKPDKFGVLYVNELKQGNGSTWEDAYPDLAFPLWLAGRQSTLSTTTAFSAPVAEIWVAAGTYYPAYTVLPGDADQRGRTFLLAEGVKLYGGFPDTANSNWHQSLESRGSAEEILRLRRTVLSGDVGQSGDVSDNAYHVVSGVGLRGGTGTAIDGFTITGGYAEGTSQNRFGIQYGSVTLYPSLGAGVMLHDANVEMSNMVITGNTNFIQSGGVAGGGGVAVLESSDVRMHNMIISANRSESGGGIYTKDAYPKLSNVLIKGNVAESGGGIYNEGSSQTELTNVTIAGNYGGTGSLSAGGIYNSAPAVPVINNSIIWANSNGESIEGTLPASLGQHNLLEGIDSRADGGLDGTDPANDPLFVHPIVPVSPGGSATDAGDYHVHCSSPVRNAGDLNLYRAARSYPNMDDETDQDGAPRLYQAQIDLGVYEDNSPICLNRGGRGIVYVNLALNGDGSSWENAYNNLADPLHFAVMQQNGISGSSIPRDTIRQIWVAAGTYIPLHSAGDGQDDRERTFLLTKRIKIYGGFPANANSVDHNRVESRFSPTCRSIECMPASILSGDIDGDPDVEGDLTQYRDNNAYHTVMAVGITAADSLVLDGFHIRGGNANTNTDIIINGHTLTHANGGGINSAHADYTMTNLYVADNYADGNGGGINCDSSAVVADRLVITANKANGLGGGITVNVSQSARISNTLISRNRAQGNGGGIHINEADTKLANITVADNRSTFRTGGLSLDGVSNIELNNSIVWGNTVDFSMTADVNVSGLGNGLTCRHSLVQDVAPGGDNMDGTDTRSNPMFTAQPHSAPGVAVAPDYYHLLAGSPAVDRGDNDLYLAHFGSNVFTNQTDLAGNPRRRSVNVDLGAYESNHIAVRAVNGIVYVKEDDWGDGSSWDQAYRNLADPLMLAAMQRDGAIPSVAPADTIRQIWVAEGSYLPAHRAGTVMNDGVWTGSIDRAFVLVPGVSLFGGFPSAATAASHPTLESRFDSVLCHSIDCLPKTMLSGDLQKNDSPQLGNRVDNSCHVVVAVNIAGSDSVALDGFHISGGYSELNMFGYGNPLIKGEEIPRVMGGGMVNRASELTLRNTVFNDNAAMVGGGVANLDGDLRMDRIRLSGNTSGYAGGAVYNYAVHGGPHGIRMSNTLISGNRSNGGGGVYNENLDLTMDNVTVVSNDATIGGGIYNAAAGGNLVLNNSIIYLNGANVTADDNMINYGTVQYRNTLVGNADLRNQSGLADMYDPQFANPVASSLAPTSDGDYWLLNTSNYIDICDSAIYRQSVGIAGYASINSSPFAWDYAGNPRLQLPRLDLGAFEFQPLRLSIDTVYILAPLSDTAICATDSITLRGYFRDSYIAGHANAANININYRWEYSADTLNSVFAPAQIPGNAALQGQSASGVVDQLCVIRNAAQSQSGFYRLAVENSSGYGQAYTHYSRPVRVSIFELPPQPDIRIYIRPEPGLNLSLSEYLDSVVAPVAAAIQWTPILGAPALVAGTENSTGMIEVHNWPALYRTYVYQYTLTACNSRTGRAYVHVIDSYDHTESVEVCTEIESSSRLNLNAIFGVSSLGGQWTSLSDPDGVTAAHLTTVSSGLHIGTVIFDARAAFTAAVNPAYEYNGSSAVKQFVVRYTASNISKTITFIVRN